MAAPVSFDAVQSISERKLQFTLADTSYPYANTLRRAMMTLVPSVGFRSDPPGQVLADSDIKVIQNDSNVQPNELLAHRLSLIPIHSLDPRKFDPDRYVFRLKVENDTSEPMDVFARDITVLERRKASDMSEALVEVPNRDIFVANRLTRETCLLATLPPKRTAATPTLHVELRATVGLGREHARFIPTCQASYGNTLDTDATRRNEWFEKWLQTHKNVDPESLKEDAARRDELDREFKSMEIQRIFKVDEFGEPNSFDFTVESVGPMAPRMIVERAIQGLIAMCDPYTTLDNGDLPEGISAQPCDAQMPGFDFLFREQDHTFGNMLQTWLADHHVEGEDAPKILFAGYKIPHPLKDEMLLRIGVEDNNELTARQAIAAAARGCSSMFRGWLATWTGEGAPAGPGPSLLGPGPKTAAAGPRRTLKVKKTTA